MTHYNLFNIINNLFSLMPSDCFLCEQTVACHDRDNDKKLLPKIICTNCHQQLPLINACCSVCAMPLPANLMQQEQAVCGACLKKSPVFSRCVAAFHYEQPISHFISRLKFNAQFQFIDLLSHYLIKAVRQRYRHESLPQTIIAVPLHPKKTKQRGFNQSDLIAQKLQKHLGIYRLTNAIERIRYTQAQTKLSAAQRHKNLKNAFKVNLNNNQYQHVAVIDDVMTTGTTANEIARQLIAAGVKRVDIWCVARAFSI